MNEQQPTSPRHRLQELLAIPERQRTDAQWDEINELEITLASANRTESRDSGQRRNAPPPSDQKKSGGAPQGKKPARKFHKRPPKGPAP
ncbi:MAG: hypothetical protein Q8N54_09005 [Sulfurimicrobium sp.]|jgi:hypothetical protein|nr:hypothetical protein [Sulfurimicrobium sp.]MDP2197246.1 hypothetical protein [Sulfurimicrobium sp.]MDP2962883.1 hypothetical protein [Sulfurimicrobium sp.]MDZ7656051.1 hypothetical protein [Sulfurimicrobium sp.]